MNFNRRRHIYTLGDFHIPQNPQQLQQIKAQQSRRNNSDPFERDPFKIQSYNFRYADRPSYHLNRVVTTPQQQLHQLQQRAKPFETYFYNYDFAATRRDKENSTSKFHEYRRRKFIQSQHIPATSILGQTQNIRAATSTAASNQMPPLSNTAAQQQQSYAQHQSNQYDYQQQQQHQVSNNSSSSVANVFPYGRRPTTTATTRTGAAASNPQRITAMASPIFRTASNTNQRLQPACSSSSQKIYKQQMQQQESNNAERPSSTLYRSFNRNGIEVPPLCEKRHTPLHQQYNTNIGSSNKNCTKSNSSTTAFNLNKTSPAAAISIYGRDSFSTDQRRAANSQNHGQGMQQQYSFTRGAAVNGHIFGAATAVIGNNNPNTNIESKLDDAKSCSGCQININIHGLDSKPLSENVTIQIESKENATTTNNLYSSPNGGTHARNKTTLNISKKESSDTVVIDKHISKYSIRERQKSYDQIHKQSSADLRKGNVVNTNTSCSVNNANANAEVTKKSSRERLPSIFPWSKDEDLRKCFPNIECNPYTTLMSPNLRPTNKMRRIRKAYHAALKDINNLRAYASSYDTPQKPTTYENANQRSFASLGSSTYSRLSTSANNVSKSPYKGTDYNLRNEALKEATAAVARTSTSNHSLRRSSNFCQNENKAPNLNKSRSIMLIPATHNRGDRPASPAAAARQLSCHSSHHSINNKSPVNVNINVYTDKLKLLRV